MTTPLMIWSDSPVGSSGLGRICRDLAIRIHENMHDVFMVGTLGIGGQISSSSRLPFYNVSSRQIQDMIPVDLPSVWADFAGKEHGILFAITNGSWVGWLSHPERMADGHPVKDFLLQRPMGMSTEEWSALPPKLRAKYAKRPFERWLYCPVDGHCPDGTLGHQMGDILSGFDRLLAYTRYGAEVMEKTLKVWSNIGLPVFDRSRIDERELAKVADYPGKVMLLDEPPQFTGPKIPNLPHGIDSTVFFPRDRQLARETLISRLSNGSKGFPMRDDMLIASAVATNTPRKDWGLAFQTCAELLSRGRNVFLWGHTNALEGHWDMRGLSRQFGMDGRVILTTEKLTDDDMAWALSACDVGLHIGAGEGFGYFGPQAMACGIPVIHGNYAGGAEFLPTASLVEPKGFHIEGKWMIQRPVFEAKDWADRVERVIADPAPREWEPKWTDPLTWDAIWPEWESWLRAGVEEA